MNSRISIYIAAAIAVAIVYTFASVANAAPAKFSVNTPSSNVALVSGADSTISWTSTGYPENLEVNINLIKKVENKPARYELVRVLAKNTKNDGSEAWQPAVTEVGNNYFIEITCSDKVIPTGCDAGITKAAIALNGADAKLANSTISLTELIRILKSILGI